MEDAVIKVSNLTKVYKLYERPMDRLKESLHPFKRTFHREFHALDNISFNIKKGETVGIIGKNGSGKSTLLKIITGVLSSTSGETEVNGKISALLELGAGFNPEFTGMQNIYLSGVMRGYTQKEIDQRVDQIIKFADIGDFINQPVKTYSSGMFVRLAFAVAINVEPDILIVDEALSVGDIRFQQKCLNKFNELKKTGCSILFVSHSMYQIQAFCDRAILLDCGKIIKTDTPKEVADLYHKMMFEEAQAEIMYDSDDLSNQVSNIGTQRNKKRKNSLFKENTHFLNEIKNRRFGTGEVRITDVELLSSKLESISNVSIHEEMVVRIHLKSYSDQDDLVIGISILNTQGIICYASNNYVENQNIKNLKCGDSLVIDFRFFVHLSPSKYTITIGCGGTQAIEKPIYFDWIDSAMEFDILGEKGKQYYSIFYIPANIEVMEHA